MKISEKDKKRFFDKVRKTDHCWVWTGGKFDNGYGNFWINHIGWRTHRISWLIHYGKILKGLCVCHTCDNKLCVNPKHLWLGTHEDNNRDRDNKGRVAHTHGEKNGNVKLVEKQVKLIRKIYKKGYTPTNTYRLAEKFNVSQFCISCIIHNKTWQHI